MAKAEWNPRRLDDLGFVGRGKSRHRPRNEAKLYGGPYPFLQTADVMGADPYITSYSQTYSEFGLQQSKMWPAGTLCMTIAGANTAKTAILRIGACFPDSIVGFIPDQSKADLYFVKYSLDLMRDRFLSVSRGATQDNLSLDKLLSFPIPVPDVDEQRRIGGILSAYDDLIENNTRRVKILEEMAQALYREWFIHFRFPGYDKTKLIDSPFGKVPKGWETKKLIEIADINASSIKRGNGPKEIDYVDISSVVVGRIENIEQYALVDAPGRARRIVKHGDIIWSCVRPNRKSYALVLKPKPNLIVSTGFAVVSAKYAPYTYLYQALTAEEFVGYLTNRATGAAYPAVTSKDFEDANLLLPPHELLALYDSSVLSHFELINDLHQKNSNLRRTRDLLLPKLISGEVTVGTT